MRLYHASTVRIENPDTQHSHPNQIVDYRTDAAGEFNELFVETGELESLW